MGFCTKEEHRQFLRDCPIFEGFLVSQGIILLKYWLEYRKRNSTSVSSRVLKILPSAGSSVRWI